MTAFTSQWSKKYYVNDSTLNRFIYVAVFEVKKDKQIVELRNKNFFRLYFILACWNYIMVVNNSFNTGCSKRRTRKESNSKL